MYNEKEIIQKAVNKAHLSMLKAEMCVDLLEEIFEAVDLYPMVNDRFDDEFWDMRETVEEVTSALGYYKI